MLNGGLCVVTHNGKPVSQGGLRLGYGIPGKFFIKAGTTVLQLWPWTPPEKPKPVKTKVSETAREVAPARRVEINVYGEVTCTHCGSLSEVARFGRSRIPDKPVKCVVCGTEHIAYRP